MMRLHAVTLVAAGLVAALSGCAFRALRKDVQRLDDMGFVGGHVTAARDDGSPIVVGLLEPAGTQVDTFVLDRPGPYFFVIPAGTYRMAAFVDRNRDGVYQPGIEPAASVRAGADLRVAPGQKVTDADVAIDGRSRERLPYALAVGQGGRRGTRELPPIELGEIVRLDDPRFSPENGKLGLWQPLEFMFQVGAGFYFLEPYDAAKTPVLFVHGAGGYPSEFRYLVEHLDRKRFQPWFVYYPSGMDLDTIARGAARWLDALRVRYRFPRLVVVAHSIGGLVSRATLNKMVAGGDGDLLAGFVTISTPWEGHAAAAAGVEHAPVVMPMWRDVEPGSAFLADLFRVPLPEDCAYALLFGYDGHSRFLDVPNDGVVAIASELAMPAQRAARRLYGFDENHTSILRSAAVSTTLNEILAETVR